MNEQVLEIIRILVSISIPLVILILGILINKTLEKSKATLSKEQDWQNWWASQLLTAAHQYNSSVSECITSLHILAQTSTEKLSGWEDEFKEREVALKDNIRHLQYLDWEIQNYIQFSPLRGDKVHCKQKELFDLLSKLISSKKGNLEKIRQVQFEFNESVRFAHAEILEISPYKASQP